MYTGLFHFVGIENIKNSNQNKIVICATILVGKVVLFSARYKFEARRLPSASIVSSWKKTLYTCILLIKFSP